MKGIKKIITNVIEDYQKYPLLELIFIRNMMITWIISALIIGLLSQYLYLDYQLIKNNISAYFPVIEDWSDSTVHSNVAIATWTYLFFTTPVVLVLFLSFRAFDGWVAKEQKAGLMECLICTLLFLLLLNLAAEFAYFRGPNPDLYSSESTRRTLRFYHNNEFGVIITLVSVWGSIVFFIEFIIKWILIFHAKISKS